MADISSPSLGFSPSAGLAQVFGKVSGFFESLHHARVVSAEFEFLCALDDAALAARGLSRDRIAQHVATRL